VSKREREREREGLVLDLDVPFQGCHVVKVRTSQRCGAKVHEEADQAIRLPFLSERPDESKAPSPRGQCDARVANIRRRRCAQISQDQIKRSTQQAPTSSVAHWPPCARRTWQYAPGPSPCACSSELLRLRRHCNMLAHARYKPARTRPGRVGPMSCVAPAAGRRGGGRPPHGAGEG